MKKIFTNYVVLFWLLVFGQLHSQVWEPVGTPTGISTGSVGRLTLLNDYQNNLVLGYYDVAATKGSVQMFNGTSWSYLGGSPGVTTANTSAYNSTSVDGNGVVYFTSQAGVTGMEVRKFDGNAWSMLPNVTNNVMNFNTSAISADNVLVAANSESSGTVKKFVNGVWQQIGTTGFAAGVPFYLDMVIGTNGKVYVSFNNAGNVHVYENNINADSNTAWQPVGGVANLGAAATTEEYNSSMAIDKNNNIYVGYVSNTAGGNKLNVKKFNGTSWTQLGNENFSQFKAKHTSIAVGSNNTVYVAMSKFDNADLLKNYVVSYNETTNSWSQVGTGFASTGQGTWNSLAVDSFGNIFLAFMDTGLAKLSVKKLNLAIVAAESIEISTENNAAPEIAQDNGTLQLKASVLPSSANQNVIWSISEGQTFATISNTGLLTAISSDAVVTVKAVSAENASIADTFDVTIKNQDSDISAESIVVATASGNSPDIFGIGTTLQLKTTILPIEADQKVIWSVQQGSSVVTVNNDGLVTAVSEGSAIVRATHIDGVLSDEIRVSVFKNGCSQGNNLPNFSFGNAIASTALGTDDFIVPEGTRFTVSKIRMNIISSANFDNVPFNLNFLKNDNGIPGGLVKEIQNIQLSSKKLIKDIGSAQFIYEIELDLPQPVTFDQGTYWLNPVAVTQLPVFWMITINGIGNGFHADNFDGNGWRITAGLGKVDGVFKIIGNCTPMPVVVKTLNGGSANVLIGDNLQLSATVNTPGISQNVNWTLESGSSFASVNSNGLVTGLAAGIATIKATSVDDANQSGTFDVTVLDPNACSREAVSNEFENAFGFEGTNDQRLAVDFEVVGDNATFTVDSIEPTVANFATSFNVIFYEDANGLPGTEIGRTNGQIVRNLVTGSEFNFYFHRYTVKLDQQFTFKTGKYWMEIETDASGWEATSADVQGNFAAYRNSITNAWGYIDGGEFVYKINGVCKTEPGMATSENSLSSIQVYPNPVKDILNISSDEKLVNVTVYNMVGQKVLGNSLNESKVKVNVANLSTGTYIVEAATTSGNVKRFKIIKN